MLRRESQPQLLLTNEDFISQLVAEWMPRLTRQDGYLK
jgi:hypothetical protein